MSTIAKRDQFHSGMEKAKDAASSATSKVGEAASQAGHTLQDAASTVGHKVEDAASAVGCSMKSFGEKVREKGPSQGLLGRASHAVADTLEQSGSYIEDKNIRGMAEDVTNLIRRNPVPALLIGVGIGFLFALALKKD